MRKNKKELGFLDSEEVIEINGIKYVFSDGATWQRYHRRLETWSGLELEEQNVFNEEKTIMMTRKDSGNPEVIGFGTLRRSILEMHSQESGKDQGRNLLPGQRSRMIYNARQLFDDVYASLRGIMDVAVGKAMTYADASKLQGDLKKVSESAESLKQMFELVSNHAGYFEQSAIDCLKEVAKLAKEMAIPEDLESEITSSPCYRLLDTSLQTKLSVDLSGETVETLRCYASGLEVWRGELALIKRSLTY